MVIGIDVRPLIGNGVSGVEIYTKELLKQLFLQYPKTTFILYCNAARKQHHLYTTFKSANVKIVHTRVPNKILNISLSWFRWPKIDRTILKKTGLQPHTFFCPDLRITPISEECKKIMVVHDLSFHHFPQYFSLQTRLWYKILNPKRELKKSDHLIAVSEFTKKDLIRTYNILETKITTIHEGIDEKLTANIPLQELQKKYNLPKDYFLFLATIEPRKNIKNLLQAFTHFNQTNSKVHLVLAGKTNPKIFATVPKQQRKNIHFIGFVEEQDKASLYTNAKAFIYPSLFEGFGLPLLEAMKVGTPVITSNISSMPEVVGDAALLIDPQEPATITAAMEKVLDPSTTKKLQSKMKDQIKKYSWEKAAKQTAKLLSLGD